MIQCPPSLMPLFDRVIRHKDSLPVRCFRSKDPNMDGIAKQLTIESHLSFVSVMIETIETKWRETMETLRDLTRFDASPSSTWAELQHLRVTSSTLAYYRGMLYGTLAHLRKMDTS